MSLYTICWRGGRTNQRYHHNIFVGVQCAVGALLIETSQEKIEDKNEKKKNVERRVRVVGG